VLIYDSCICLSILNNYRLLASTTAEFRTFLPAAERHPEHPQG
jgi:hypothetical protein